MRPCFPKPNKDHWGFFTVDHHKTYSKLDAVEVSARTGQEIVWHFNDQAFDNFDWTHEPPGDLLNWYGYRAQQLRDTYDYLILMYSGGADSHNMLRAFIDNNIFVDEIVQLFVLENTNNEKTDEVNKESFTISIPQTQKLVENYPLYKNTKHRLIDGGEFMTTALDRVNMFDYWHLNSNHFYSPWGCLIGGFKTITNDYRKLADQGKNLGFIWGMNKPEIAIVKNQFYIEFADRGISNLVTPQAQIQNDQWYHDEMFYWTPDLPELSCKQGHILKRYLEGTNEHTVDGVNIRVWNPSNDHMHTLPTESYLSIFEKDGKKYELTAQGLHSLIYPYWNHNTKTTPKPPSPMFGKKDSWLWNSNVESKGLDRYYKGVFWLRQHVKKIKPDLWWEKPFDPAKARYCGGLKNFSKFHKLST